MKISYHGHSIVKIETNGKTILIDPFITGNELTDLKADEVKADAIILTHGHSDHVGDTVEIAKRNHSQVIAINELAVYLGKQGLNTHGMSIGELMNLILEKSNSHKRFTEPGLKQKMDRSFIWGCRQAYWSWLKEKRFSMRETPGYFLI